MSQSETVANTAPSLPEKTEAGFWVVLFRGSCLLFCRPYYCGSGFLPTEPVTL